MRLQLTIYAFLAIGCCAASGQAIAQDFEQEPIRYSQSEPNNRVSRLIERLGAGEVELAHEEHFGYLRSLLTELDVPVSSQMPAPTASIIPVRSKSAGAGGTSPGRMATRSTSATSSSAGNRSRGNSITRRGTTS
jgi:hypothetical protein